MNTYLEHEVNKQEEVFFQSENHLVGEQERECQQDVWKILVVDDEGDVHQITHMVLEDLVFENKPLYILSAYSAQEAKRLLEQHPDSALVLLDVVMENHNAGLKLVEYIRKTLNNPFIHIILRTGQPGYAPERDIIRKYEINGYTNKAELTAQKMATLVTSSLRSYSELITIENYRQQLEIEVIERTKELIEKNARLVALNDTLRKVNIDLVRLNQEKNEFLGIAAHDLKSPLASIQGLASLIERNYDSLPRDEVISMVSMIRLSSSQMFELIRNILDVNMIESGRLKLSPEVIDIAVLLHSLVKEYTPFAEKKNISLHFQKGGGKMFSFLDSQIVRQVLDNILSNAVKYSPADKNIFVRIHHHDKFISCEVQDEGPGLSDEEQLKLFGKFMRLTPRPTGNEHSTGLGLFIVKKLLDAMKGRVKCKSRLGQGSLFTVEFPFIETQWMEDYANNLMNQQG